MSRNNVVYTAKNEGVVGNAEILCDGITVLAGPNGCGKSTILKKVLHPRFKKYGYVSPITGWQRGSWIDDRPLGNLREVFEAYDETSKVREPESLAYKTTARVEELLGGYFYYDEEIGEPYFFPNKPRQQPYSAQCCSNGELTLGFLQAALLLGCWEDKHLIVLDSPDAYLSPDWIVEYARLIVWINKALGTRFVISTHNPDMVSAIRYISETEETLDAVRFYLAKKNDDGRYDYRECVEDEKSIEPIFKFFATALDKISEYSCEEVKKEGSDNVNVV